LAAGAVFTCGADLGGGAVVFFWSPAQAKVEKISRTKITVNFLMISLFGMSNLLTISQSSESFVCDFTIENGRKLKIP
jgi:hypothetical protein